MNMNNLYYFNVLMNFSTTPKRLNIFILLSQASVMLFPVSKRNMGLNYLRKMEEM